jgi:hypothetical protein
MDKSEGIKILKQLADGIDPYTGEVFPEDSPYQHPQTVRALYYAVMALEGMNDKQPNLDNGPANAGKSWDKIEDTQLITDFDSGMSIKDLALKHQRTRGAIQSRLIRLGKFVM